MVDYISYIGLKLWFSARLLMEHLLLDALVITDGYLVVITDLRTAG